ncbi:1fb9f75a-592e-4197-aa15-89d85e07b508 [Sclerotinia trifoliorum]|uniref:1fb9f75a-592e-4197-aa15-89d85e07b508 n=1 Tax=Sclerotinia trifoliorum TaxID=28548 RepID=A0A8H2W196_9HELO|nr:1fb9f75a-592e-4197-aa15-89d85e07b508 [Sclerotinia trifoliorum]
MQFFTLPIITLLFTSVLAVPTDLESRDLESRANCYKILPACQGGSVSGQTDCRCKGQVGACDVMVCPGSGSNTVMVCGQSGTGCVWI